MCMVPTLGATTSNSAETPPVSFDSIMENTRQMVLNFTMIKIGWTMISFCQLSKRRFQRRLLRNFDSELLIGQISYNQRANIYNTIHGYNGRLMKTRSAKKGDSEPAVTRQKEISSMIKGTF